MSDPTAPNENATPPNPPDVRAPKSDVRLRMWPAVVIVLAHLAVSGGFWVFGSTNIHSLISLALAPICAAVSLALWWLTASRAPVLDRFVGLALFAAAAAGAVAMQKHDRVFILIAALPTMTTGVIAVLAATQSLRWRARRWAAIIVILACGACFSALRVDSLGGSLFPILSWRWNPTAEEKLAVAPNPASADVNRVATLPDHVDPADWPGFRGPARDGRVTGQSFSTDWTTPPKEVWRKPVGLGWSSFTVIGDYLFTQEQRGGEELVKCYRADTGEDVWTNRVETRFEDNMGSGPRATSTYDQGKLYTLGGTGILQALDAATGKPVWKRDIVADTGAKMPQWGFADSPLVVGERVVVFSGGAGKSVAAYNRATGDIAWRAGKETNGYSSPHFARIAETPQIVMLSDFGLQSFVPETGALLWEHAWQAKPNPRVVQPLFVEPNSMLLGTPGNMGTRALHVQKQGEKWSVDEGWTSTGFRPYFNDGVFHNGACYGFDGNRLICIDAATGKSRWEGKRCGGQVLLIAHIGVLLVLTEAGDVFLVSATPDQYRELAHFKALSGKTWNHPVVARGKLFVRNSEEAACFALPPSQKP